MAKILERIIRAGAARLVIKAAKAAPVIGSAVAIGLVAYEVKKKGLVKGLVNTALDATIQAQIPVATVQASPKRSMSR